MVYRDTRKAALFSFIFTHAYFSKFYASNAHARWLSQDAHSKNRWLWRSTTAWHWRRQIIVNTCPIKSRHHFATPARAQSEKVKRLASLMTSTTRAKSTYWISIYDFPWYIFKYEPILNYILSPRHFIYKRMIFIHKLDIPPRFRERGMSWGYRSFRYASISSYCSKFHYRFYAPSAFNFWLIRDAERWYIMMHANAFDLMLNSNAPS